MDLADKNRIYTYADYLRYPESERVELIDGHIYAMTPSPSRIHQGLISEISFVLNAYIKANKGECKVYPAPFDVVLTDSEDINSSQNVVQPDISVICDKNKLTPKGCTGSPDLIIEIVSPYNPNSDYIRKLALYSQYKVREYWIVNPMKESVLIYKLDETGGFAEPEIFTFKDKIKFNIFEDLEIDFASLSLE